MHRTLFGREGTYQLEEAIAFVNTLQMKQLRLWHVTWSPASTEDVNKKKDLDLWKIARETMKYLQKHLDPNMEFIVAEHNDHTDIPHVQGLVFVNGWINRDDLIRMGEIALKKALEQRRFLDRGQENLLFNHEHQQKIRELWKQIQESERSRRMAPYFASLSRMKGGRAKRVKKVREPTLPCPRGGMHSMVRLKGERDKYYCPTHDQVYEAKVQKRRHGLRL